MKRKYTEGHETIEWLENFVHKMYIENDTEENADVDCVEFVPDCWRGSEKFINDLVDCERPTCNPSMLANSSRLLVLSKLKRRCEESYNFLPTFSDSHRRQHR